MKELMDGFRPTPNDLAKLGIPYEDAAPGPPIVARPTPS
jgi:hypothetical protein